MAENDTRMCNDCGELKPVAEFRPKGPRQVRNHCVPCSATRARKWRHADPDRAYDQHLRRKYGITLDDYLVMAAEQAGGCAICGELPTKPGHANKNPDAPPRLYVDHCHTTGRIRGLLCSPCNKGIGYFGDDPSKVRRAVAYLERDKG